ncbi:uncharacterized protein LOC110981281 [Acanthaster planci]|uniref:Uncharacterized protein LOC110981281 n=1 Tax=Acanthaster planci TaxID=133434 RepID=A0A8B7YPQ2_ACAPL|nr:uncharacterized protein LOC110981281 [Acanthaster planci]XP_022094428.1 uncharacterized protein LOC110981281 [Acanthaster planci]XP_022094429.1 uncharacterized protein LOC110981281 [Acanthaster planci]XP_022094430.1 uncharacterized protein LOC110981281 [Acanthaster planci]XP_022094431.1 uncharacterized protein LOC110981281 [Acanthaster planci]XP_022094432.1 uncharacterized protein LOC110981281 [Acanthaster planci]
MSSSTVSCNEETIDRGGDSKSSSCLNLSTSNIVDAEVANLQEKDPVKSVPPVTSQQITKTLDERFLGHLGLRKIDKECQQGGSKTENAASKKDSGKEYIGIGVDQQGGAGGSMSGDGQNSKEDSDLQVKGSSRQASQPKVLPASQPLKAVSDVSKFSTIKVISPVGENSSLAELDISGMNNGISKDGQGASIPSSNSLSNPVKNSPIYIKVKLEEKDVTVICCPVALLLQHKEILDVTLQANDPNSYSITCRKCSHVVSDPYTMLQHLKVQHQIQGCLQKLLNLNSQYLSCMSQPLCVNITGVLTLPDGLSDMEQGIIRFNSMGIPKLSFVCRLCPLSFHTARGLCAHHQYFIRSRSQQTSDNSMWFCRLCPRQFQSFMDYYAHHKWMRVAKELFVSTDQVNKRKRFEVMNESGKVVASMEVPKTHSFAIKPWPVTNPDSCEDIGWGHKPSLNDRAPQGKVEPLIPEADDQAFYIDAGTPGPSTITLVSTPDGISSKQPDEADKGKRMTPPLFQTLDSLCRRLAQRVDTSTGLDKVISVGDKQIDEDHEYLCGICHKTFPRLPQMQGHMGSHVRRRRANKYAPPPPVAVASSPADPPSVERAPTVEPLDVEYKCGVCSETFPKLDQMEIHMECHNRPHQTTQPPVKSPPMKSLDTPFLETVKLMSLTCDICHWSFPTERKLWDHRSTHAQKKTEETGSSMSSRASGGIQRKTLYVCVYCKKSFAREVNLRFHLKKHSTEVADESSQTTGNVLTSPDMQAQHACSVCGRAFRSHRQLRSHMVWHAKFHKGADKPPVSLVEAGGASKKSLVCNTCDKVCCSDWELRLHKKKHASPKRLLVRHTLANEDSDPAKKRTLAQRACNLNNKEGVSDTAAPGSSTLRRSTRPRREGLYKYFCRNCRSYFQSSQQFARHMAVHTNMAGPSHRTSPGSPSNKTRGSDSGQVLMQKQSDGDVSDDSGGGIDMSWSPSPSSADEQPPPIDKLGSDTSEILTDKKVSEENENCVTTEDSGPAVEDTSQILKETAADEQSPHSSAKPTEKQNTDPVMSSAVCKGASAEMKEKILALNQGEAAEEQSVPLCSDSKVCEDVDVLMTAANQVTGSNKSSAGSEGLKILSQSKKLSANSSIWDGIMPNVETQPKAPSIVLLEDCQVKKQDRDLKTQTQTTVYENSSSVMVRVSPEGSRIAPDEQASETNEAHLQTDDQSGKELSTDASCQNTVDDTSNTVTQKKDKGSGLISTEECSASPSFNKGHVEATERPVQKNIGGPPSTS